MRCTALGVTTMPEVSFLSGGQGQSGMDRSILVTGANGFVGRQLCSDLVRSNFRVKAVLRSLTPLPCGVEAVKANLTDDDTLRAALIDVSCIVHLAGRAHVINDTDSDALSQFRLINRDYSVHLAALAIESGVRRFIYISSIGVNGSYPGEDVVGERSVECPDKDYALSKLEAEQRLVELFKASSTELVIIRPPLVYGGEAPGNFERLLKLVKLQVPLPFGSVANKRSMVSLRNLCNFITVCITHPKASGELFVISDGVDFSLPQILRLLAEGMSRKAFMFRVPMGVLVKVAKIARKEGLFQQVCGSYRIDSSKARSLLDWAPPYKAESELRQAGQDYLRLGKDARV